MMFMNELAMTRDISIAIAGVPKAMRPTYYVQAMWKRNIPRNVQGINVIRRFVSHVPHTSVHYLSLLISVLPLWASLLRGEVR